MLKKIPVPAGLDPELDRARSGHEPSVRAVGKEIGPKERESEPLESRSLIHASSD
jgi:hypothetical protein